MQLHARGVELVCELLDAADHVEGLTPAEMQALLKETARVMGDLLKRDVPERDDDEPPPRTDGTAKPS